MFHWKVHGRDIKFPSWGSTVPIGEHNFDLVKVSLNRGVSKGEP